MKSLKDSYYRDVCGGWMEPVLKAAMIIRNSGRHVEYKNLVVNDFNDNNEDIVELVDWFVDTIGPDVPLHFVSAHPDYKLTSIKRTEIERLESARGIAMEKGVRYCYLGNVFVHPGLNTYCPKCGNMLIERIGIGISRNTGISEGKCSRCSETVNIYLDTEKENARHSGPVTEYTKKLTYDWRDNLAIHIEVLNRSFKQQTLECVHIDRDGNMINKNNILVEGNSEWREMIPKLAQRDVSLKIHCPSDIGIKIFELRDRAQYPP